MKHLIILRGPSGCGKSEFARTLSYGCLEQHLSSARICSADDYFLIGDAYLFDRNTLPEAHAECKRSCESAMQDEAESIIIDNPNMQHWEYQPYVQLAEKYGYSYSVIVVGMPWKSEELFKRNVHGVPLDVIRNQIAKFTHHI